MPEQPIVNYAEFEKDLQALLDKHGVVLYPVPAYVQDKDGHFHHAAEIKVVPKPPVASPLEVKEGIIQPQ